MVAHPAITALESWSRRIESPGTRNFVSKQKEVRKKEKRKVGYRIICVSAAASTGIREES